MTVYLGLNRNTAHKYHAVYMPILRIVPYSRQTPSVCRAQHYLTHASHILLTSPSSTSLFLSSMKRWRSKKNLEKKHYLCIGEITARRLTHILPKAQYSLAHSPTSEGLLPLLSSLPITAHILYPHSALSRSIIKNHLIQEDRFFFAYPHYTIRGIRYKKALFSAYHRVILTSPSGVRAYAALFPELPDKEHLCLGIITQQEFRKIYNQEAPSLESL